MDDDVTKLAVADVTAYSGVDPLACGLPDLQLDYCSEASGHDLLPATGRNYFSI